jgi:hypothetical protein
VDQVAEEHFRELTLAGGVEKGTPASRVSDGTHHAGKETRHGASGCEKCEQTYHWPHHCLRHAREEQQKAGTQAQY